MEKELVIDVTTFMKMFVSISFLQEQRIFSYDRIRSYLKNSFLSKNVSDCNFDDLIEELNNVLTDMYKEEILLSIDGNLYQITSKIDYKDIIESNHELLKDMILVFYNVCGGNEKSVYFVPSNQIKKNNR